MRIAIGLFVLTLLHSQQATPVQAQPGTLDGLVRTPDGKLAPHVLVTVLDEKTDLFVKAFTDARGYYAFSALPPGQYAVRMELEGLSLSFLATGVEIVAGRRHGLDVTLVVSREESVDVDHTLDSHGLSTRNGTAARFDRRFIDTASLVNGRTLQSVLPSVSGIVITESTGTLGQYTTLGQSRFANRLTIDDVGTDPEAIGSSPKASRRRARTN